MNYISAEMYVQMVGKIRWIRLVVFNLYDVKFYFRENCSKMIIGTRLSYKNGEVRVLTNPIPTHRYTINFSPVLHLYPRTIGNEKIVSSFLLIFFIFY